MGSGRWHTDQKRRLLIRLILGSETVNANELVEVKPERFGSLAVQQHGMVRKKTHNEYLEVPK